MRKVKMRKSIEGFDCVFYAVKEKRITSSIHVMSMGEVLVPVEVACNRVEKLYCVVKVRKATEKEILDNLARGMREIVF